MRVIVQVVEIGIALTVGVLVVGLLGFIINAGFFTYFNEVFREFLSLFGGYSFIIFQAFTIAILVLVVRWFVSLISNNGGERPNT